MPIRVAIPDADRAALRSGGGAPARFIREMDEPGAVQAPIELWPHELDFSAGTVGEKDETWEHRPVDLGWFFGLGRAEDARRLKENEQRVIPLLSDPLVCVVFLDELRQTGGYAKFKTFGAVKGWADRLQRALSVRFPHEPRIGRAERSLVLVSRKQRVVTTEDELKAFRLCIGVNRAPNQEDIPGASRLFTSCYFLDYNLRLGASGRPFLSEDVWEIALGRLLLAFALSENGDGKPFYARPGVKVWRNADCRVGLVPEEESHGVEESLGALTKKIRERLEIPAGETSVIVNTPSPEALRTELDAALKEALPDGTGDEDWRKEKTFPDGWSDFDGSECLRQTCDKDGTRWGGIFRNWKAAFPGWRRRHRDTGIFWELKQTFTGIGNSPSNVSSEVARLRDRLNEGTTVSDPVVHWKTMAAKERSRAGLLEQLAANTGEFERARSHYVGIGIGSLVFLAVTAALGWAGYHVAMSASALFGGGAAMYLPLAAAVSGCVAAGSLAAFIVVTMCHRSAGGRAMKSLIETSKAADKAMKERDEEARKIVAEGMAASASARIRAGRFRAWMLLKRLQTMLDTELSPKLAVGRPAGDAGSADAVHGESDSSDEASRESVRRDFLKATRTEFGPFGLGNLLETETSARRRVDEWWNGTFMSVWRDLARGDIRKAGNYPARLVVPSLRKAMSGFLEAVRSDLRKQAGEANREELEQDFGVWKKRQGDGRSLYEFASAGLTGANVDERAADAAVIFYNPSEVEQFVGATEEANGGVTNVRTILGPAILRSCPSLEGTEWIGLVHHEVRVRFGVDKDGHLVFSGESHGG